MEQLALVAGYVIVALVGLLGLLILFYMMTGRIDLTWLISEKENGGAASLSRFQFLLFTFVVAMCILVLTLEGGEFPQLNEDILGLLGISGGSYLIAKGIQHSTPRTTTKQTVAVVTEEPKE